jgi:hypothetical protein
MLIAAIELVRCIDNPCPTAYRDEDFVPEGIPPPGRDKRLCIAGVRVWQSCHEGFEGKTSLTMGFGGEVEPVKGFTDKGGV